MEGREKGLFSGVWHSWHLIMEWQDSGLVDVADSSDSIVYLSVSDYSV